MIPEPDIKTDGSLSWRIDADTRLWWHPPVGRSAAHWVMYRTTNLELGAAAPAALLDEIRRKRQAEEIRNETETQRQDH